MKTHLILGTLFLLASCSSVTTEMNQKTADVYNGASAIDNASNGVDRAIATEKRFEDKWFHTKK